MQQTSNHKTLNLAITQMACSWDIESNLDRAEALVRKAHTQGANLILLQELFATPYFCPEQSSKYFDYAEAFENSTILKRFSALAGELGVVLPISYFEKSINIFYNSIAIANADGTILGQYRKTHIPQGPGYEEKFYFSPGNTGFRVWDSAVGKIGVGICWDQWFPETARAMTLMGADILLYPTAIGNEPHDPSINSKLHWQQTMQGHAAANMCALAASNRIGSEHWENADMHFYGGSFIANAQGSIVASLDRQEDVAIQNFDLAQMRQARYAFGLFRDRRPEMYHQLTQ